MILFLSRGLELYLLCNRFSKVSADEEKFTLSSKLIFLNHILSLFYFKSSNRLPLHSEYSPYSLDGPSHFSNFISQFLYISPWNPYSPKCSQAHHGFTSLCFDAQYFSCLERLLSHPLPDKCLLTFQHKKSTISVKPSPSSSFSPTIKYCCLYVPMATYASLQYSTYCIAVIVCVFVCLAHW